MIFFMTAPSITVNAGSSQQAVYTGEDCTIRLLLTVEDLCLSAEQQHPPPPPPPHPPSTLFLLAHSCALPPTSLLLRNTTTIVFLRAPPLSTRLLSSPPVSPSICYLYYCLPTLHPLLLLHGCSSVGCTRYPFSAGWCRAADGEQSGKLPASSGTPGPSGTGWEAQAGRRWARGGRDSSARENKARELPRLVRIGVRLRTDQG